MPAPTGNTNARGDFTGQSWNGCTALRRSHKNNQNNWLWVFSCPCGKEFTTRVAEVRRGDTRSCGCLGHPSRRTINATTYIEWSVYRAWQAMKARCYDPNNADYKNYGDRGISVCNKWLNNFPAFRDDMGPKSNVNLTLERIDNNGNYEPSNCKWATRKEQANNRG